MIFLPFIKNQNACNVCACKCSPGTQTCARLNQFVQRVSHGKEWNDQCDCEAQKMTELMILVCADYELGKNLKEPLLVFWKEKCQTFTDWITFVAQSSLLREGWIATETEIKVPVLSAISLLRKGAVTDSGFITVVNTDVSSCILEYIENKMDNVIQQMTQAFHTRRTAKNEETGDNRLHAVQFFSKNKYVNFLKKCFLAVQQAQRQQVYTTFSDTAFTNKDGEFLDAPVHSFDGREKEAVLRSANLDFYTFKGIKEFSQSWPLCMRILLDKMIDSHLQYEERIAFARFAYGMGFSTEELQSLVQDVEGSNGKVTFQLITEHKTHMKFLQGLYTQLGEMSCLAMTFKSLCPFAEAYKKKEYQPLVQKEMEKITDLEDIGKAVNRACNLVKDLVPTPLVRCKCNETGQSNCPCNYTSGGRWLCAEIGQERMKRSHATIWRPSDYVKLCTNYVACK